MSPPENLKGFPRGKKVGWKSVVLTIWRESPKRMSSNSKRRTQFSMFYVCIERGIKS